MDAAPLETALQITNEELLVTRTFPPTLRDEMLGRVRTALDMTTRSLVVLNWNPVGKITCPLLTREAVGAHELAPGMINCPLYGSKLARTLVSGIQTVPGPPLPYPVPAAAETARTGPGDSPASAAVL